MSRAGARALMTRGSVGLSEARDECASMSHMPCRGFARFGEIEVKASLRQRLDVSKDDLISRGSNDRLAGFCYDAGLTDGKGSAAPLPLRGSHPSAGGASIDSPPRAKRTYSPSPVSPLSIHH